MEEEELENDALAELLGLIGDLDYEENTPVGQVREPLAQPEVAGELDEEWQKYEQMMDLMPIQFSHLEEVMGRSNKFRSVPLGFKKDVGELYLNEEAFSAQVLDGIEAFLLDYLDGTEKYTQGKDELSHIIALYIGEYVVENRDGEWMVWSKKASSCYGKPVVAIWKNNNYGHPLDPFELVKELLLSREKGLFRKAVNSL